MAVKINAQIIFLFVILMLSCSNHDADRRLDEAQRKMDQAPDSALLVLESIALDDLKSESDRALYGMLYTQALDKNHLSPQNDSLISASADYYARGNNRLNQVISTYYLGRTFYNKGSYAPALVNFFKAREIAIDNEYYFWAGMACRGISDIYNQTYNRAEELSFAKQEYDFIKKSGKQPYLNWALHDLCRAVYNVRDVSRADSLTLQLLDSANIYDDPYLRLETLRARMMINVDENRFDMAYPVISEILESGMADMSDSLYMCDILIEKGNLPKAQEIFNNTSDGNIQLKSYIRYKIAKRERKHDVALKEAEYLDSINNKTFKSAVSHNLTTTLTDYFDLRKKLDEAEINTYRMKLWSIVIGSAVVLVLIICLGIYLYKRNRRRISEKIFLAQQLQEDLSRAQNENSMYSKTIKNLESEKQGLQQQLNDDSARNVGRDAKLLSIIQDLLASKYELFEELSSISIQSKDSKTAEKKIASAVSRLVNDLSSPKGKIVELENEVNSIYDNLISDFKKDLPNLKDADYMLFLFSIFNFSNATISMLLKEEKILAVYNRRKRLKEKIKQLDEAKRDKYLKFLT